MLKREVLLRTNVRGRKWKEKKESSWQGVIWRRMQRGRNVALGLTGLREDLPHPPILARAKTKDGSWGRQGSKPSQDRLDNPVPNRLDSSVRDHFELPVRRHPDNLVQDIQESRIRIPEVTRRK